ncbi:MAG: YncE family protein [Candidatus Moranbacteria bacterium]|nr:YncE family protein [Candidatus Moranbacteria bacterium]
MEEDVLPFSPIDLYGSRGVFIINEGNYLYGNASLSYYDIDSGEVINELFALANRVPLGDVAYSMQIYHDKAYIVVNNSGCIHVVDANTLQHKATIENLPSPRHILFLSDDKAFVSDLYARAISVINPQTYEVIGSIQTGDTSQPNIRHSSEYLIKAEGKVFTNSWSYDNHVLVVDIDEQKVVDTIKVGVQPLAMAKDKNNNIWVINDGGYSGNPAGHEIPSLMRINTQTHRVELSINFSSITDNVGQIATNPAGDSLYYICNHLYAMHVDDVNLPTEPLIHRNGRNLRALAIDPITGDIYLSDASDFMSEGTMYRFTSKGLPVDTIGVGIIPGNFCFN